MAYEPLALLAGGFLLGLLLAAPPGPVMAIMATEASRGRAGASLRTAFGAMTADAVWLAVAGLGFVAFLDARPRLIGALGLAGAALLLWMAWGTWRAARVGIQHSEIRGGYKLGFVTILTSPFSLAYWLANGALLLDRFGAWGIAGLFAGLIAYTVAFTYGVVWLGRRVERLAEMVAYVSVVALAAFGAWVAWTSVAYLTA